MTEDSLNLEVIQKLSRINRRLFLMCFFVLAIAPVAGKSIAGLFLNSAKRCSHSGEAVKLLSNIGDQYKDPSLYKENESIIASWKAATNEVEYIDPNYRGRIHMDEKRNIWILGVERRDAGKYFAKFGLDDERLYIELIVKGEPTEEQLQECQNICQDSPKEEFGGSSSEDHSYKSLMFTSCIFVIVLMDIGIKLFIFVYSQCKTKKLTDDHINEQMQKCLEVYPVLMEKYLGNLTEDQIGEQIQKLLSVYPGHFMKKFLDQNGIHPINQFTHEELAVSPKEVGNEMEDNQSHLVSQQGKVISPKMCGDSGLDPIGILPIITPTLEELKVTPNKVGNETEDNQTPLDSTLDQPENQKLPLIPVDAGTEREVNQGQLVSSKEELVTSQTGISPRSVDAGTKRMNNQKKWMSSEDELVTSRTCISSNSDTFSEPGHSGIQPFNKDEQDASPEGDMAQTDVKSLGVLVKEDSDSLSDEESREPLLKDYGDQTL